MGEVRPLSEVMEARALNQSVAALRALLNNLLVAKGEDDAAKRRLLIADAHHHYAALVSGFSRLHQLTTEALVTDIAQPAARAMFAASVGAGQ